MFETFEQRLEQSRHSPLYESLPKYQHVQRLGHEDVAGLLDGEVVVQEKLDGANATVAMVDGQLVVATRNQACSIGGQPPTGFNGLVEYVLAHEGIRTLLADHPDWILRGEWLVRHSLGYDVASYGKFYVFDVQLWPDCDYLPPEVYGPELAARGIPTAPEVARTTNPSVDALALLATGQSAFGPHREGVVVKRYGFRNEWGRTVWGKVVSADFKVKNALHFGATKDDPPEVRFAARFATDAFVLKTIHSLADAKGESPRVQHMGFVMRKVWHDLFTEEMFDFVTDEKVDRIDFKALRKMVETKTRDVALAFYNGVPSVHQAVSGAEATA